MIRCVVSRKQVAQVKSAKLPCDRWNIQAQAIADVVVELHAVLQIALGLLGFQPDAEQDLVC